MSMWLDLPAILAGQIVTVPTVADLPTTGISVGAIRYTEDTQKLYYWNGSSWVLLDSGAITSGDVVGPASAVADAIAVFSGTTGKIIKDSGITITAGVLSSLVSLGIGTGAPLYPLHILSSTDTLAVVQTTNAGSGAQITTYNSGSGVDLYLSAMTTEGRIGTFTNFPVAFYTNDLERARISAAGSFGIGTTSPAALFSVGSTSQFRVDGSGNLTRVNDVAYSWPAAHGSAGQFLQDTDGAGTLSWASAGAPPTFKADWINADGDTKTITHSLGTRDIMIQVYNNDGVSWETVLVSDNRTSTSAVALSATFAPAVAWRVLITALN